MKMEARKNMKLKKEKILWMMLGIFLVFLMPKNVLAGTQSNNWVWPTYIHTLKNDWPNYASGSYHGGTDFPVPLNTDVHSSCDGEVVSVQYLTTSYGKHIKIKATVNGQVVYMRYCHLNEILVKEGQHVTAGEIIGKSGSTGNSTGPHLHYEVRNSADSYKNALNPRLYLPGTSYTYSTSSQDLVQDGAYPTPITCVPAISSGRINVYDKNGNVETNRWIDANDQCTIKAVYTNGMCYVEYPSGSGKREAYAKKGDFITNTVIPYTWSPSVQLESYRKSDLQGGSFGKVFTTDKCTVVGKNGAIWQLIYPIAGGYKLGWVNTANVTPSQPSVPNPSVIPSPKFVDFVGNKQIVVMIPDKITFSSSAYISAGDICIINTDNVGQGQCTVRYPSGGNNVFNNYKTIKDATINIEQAISYNPDFAYQKATAQEKYTVYPTAALTQSVGGNSTNWSLDPGDEYYTINKSGDATEVLYYCNTGAHSGYWKIGWAYIPYYTLDLNGYLDQNVAYDLNGYGCVDVYVNGNQLGQNVTDFCQQFPCGSTYEFKNIQAFNGFTYTGVQQGALSGIIKGNLDIRLAFVKNAAICTGINIESKPLKVEYLEGDSWNLDGLSITASYSDGTIKNVTGSCQITGYDSTPGVKTIKISYSGFETAFSVNVNRKELEKLEIASLPDKIIYKVGEKLDYTGLQLKAYYNNGTSEFVEDYTNYVGENITDTEGTKNIELWYSYNGKSKYVLLEITVENPYKEIVKLNIDDAYTTLEGKICTPLSGDISYGLIYKEGRVKNLDLNTAGRTQIVFTELTADDTFSYDMLDMMGYTYRAYVIYIDSNGKSKVEYSDPVFG